MIKSIEKIRGLGVYQHYSKPAGTQDFGIKNLIYGWNYSGKTTLSRLFAQLETRTANPDLSACEFTFGTGNDAITEKNFQQCRHTVRVFNSDFVRDNLHFDGGDFNPIVLLGINSEKAQRKIDELSAVSKRSASILRTIDKKIGGFKERIAEAKTASAKLTRNHLRIDPYTASHLANDVRDVLVLNSKLLSAKELEEAIDLALTPDSKKPNTVSELWALPSINALYEDAVPLLTASPSFSNTIAHLENNPEIEDWVEGGLPLHRDAENCEFCGNSIAQSRLDAFRAHFSKDLADHKANVQQLFDRVKASKLQLAWSKNTEIDPKFREEYNDAAEALSMKIEAFNRAVSTLVDDVQAKVDNPRKAMRARPLAKNLEDDIQISLAAVNLIITKNNALASNFVREKTDALRKARNHYAQQFVDDLEKAGFERKKERFVERGKLLEAYISRIEPEIEKLQAEINQAQQGREKINERLLSMLGSEAVQIKVIKDVAHQDRFQLIRKNGMVAKNLSDGERTAIAFSYFLTKLQEIPPPEFEETIVYIDDPISSLDSNHIFQVTAAIRALFFMQVDKDSPWKTTCRQLFVSTHNFEFFNLLREIKPVASNKGAKLFLVKRISETSSTFGDMPASLARYPSEYHFLFEVIHRFHQAPDKTAHEVLMLLPNAMRRFIELYTYSRLPGPKDSEQVDERAEKLFGVERAKRVLKVFHYFSHGNTLDRLAGNNDLICDLENAVKDLIDAITEYDKPHMDALRASMDA